MDPRWLLRAKRWAQNPPSLARVILVLSIIVACLALYWAERIWGMPDWIAPNDMRRLSR